MIEISRHIEILLLTNDCVIVPELGGFMTHHVSARYDEAEQLFLPPLRTLGFNPQLKMNDSLLAQSYVEAYDISYPEAVRRIEAEVNELKSQLDTEGYFELNGIGSMSLNDDGNIVFEPCEAGVLTPALYGLSSFEMKRLNAETVEKRRSAAKTVQEPATLTVAEAPQVAEVTETTDESHNGAIVIKMSWIRNVVAAAAAILAFLIITPPVANSNQAEPTVNKMEMLPMTPKKAKAETPILPKEEVKKATQLSPEPAKVEPVKTEPVKTEPVVKPQPKTSFCLVLASQVAQKNAEIFVAQLQKKGIDARINTHHGTRRVVSGNYASEGEAYQALSKLRQTSEELAEAWVYKLTEE